MEGSAPGRDGSSSSRGRGGRGRGKPEPQWLPKPNISGNMGAANGVVSSYATYGHVPAGYHGQGTFNFAQSSYPDAPAYPHASAATATSAQQHAAGVLNPRSRPLPAAVATGSSSSRSAEADDTSSKSQKAAVTSRFLPVRGLQQHLTQVSRQSSLPQSPTAAAAAAAATAAVQQSMFRPSPLSNHTGSSSSSSGFINSSSSSSNSSQFPGSGRGRGRGRGSSGPVAAAAAVPAYVSYIPPASAAVATAVPTAAGSGGGRGRGRGRSASYPASNAPGAAAAAAAAMQPPAAAAAARSSDLSAGALPFMPSPVNAAVDNAQHFAFSRDPYNGSSSSSSRQQQLSSSTSRQQQRQQKQPKGHRSHLQKLSSDSFQASAAASAALAAAAAAQLNDVAATPRQQAGGSSCSSSNSAQPPAAAAAGTGGYLPLGFTDSSSLSSSSSSSSRGRGRGRGPDAAAAAAGSSQAGRGSHYAQYGGSSSRNATTGAFVTSAVAAAMRRRGRGRGRLSGYSYAGSRLPDDNALPAFNTAASAATDGSNALHLLPANEDALFISDTPTATMHADDSFAAALTQQQQQQQQQQQRSGSADALSADPQFASKQQQEGKATIQQSPAKANAQSARGKKQKQQQQHQQAAAAVVSSNVSDRLTCVVCLEHPSMISITPCDHHQLCALCCLRLRMCYKDNRCPLCKTEAKKVMIISTPQSSDQIPTFDSLISDESEIWQKPKWATGVMAKLKDTVYVQTQRKKLPVYVRLLQMTANACSICDSQGQRPMKNIKNLSDHLMLHHEGRVLCPTCVTAGRKFPLELETFTPQGLQQHQGSQHKRCEFCDIWFYAVDELWSHMNERHFLCNICQAAGTPHLYFKDSIGLRQHYAAAHHPCFEGECAFSGLVAFATEQELREHRIERHSSKMPRFKKSNARQILIDVPSSMPRHSNRRREQQQQHQTAADGAASSSSAAVSSRGGSSSSRGIRALQQSSSNSQLLSDIQDEGLSSSGTAAAAAANGRRTASAGNPAAAAPAPAAGDTAAGQNSSSAAAAASDPYAVVSRLGEGGLQMIDDDVGMTYESSQQQQQQHGSSNTTQQQQQQWPSLPGDGIVFAANPGSSSGRSQQQQEDEEFPDLQAAAAAADTAAAQSAAAAAGPQLVKATAHCACGRRQMHLAIKQGSEVPKLPCDKQCEQQQRRHQIADAFGVDSPDHHVAYWDKHRTPTYSPTLLQAYKQDPVFIEQLEQQFISFLASSSSSSSSARLTLDPMTKPQRQIVHEYAEQGFGFVSHSTGSEPNRRVQLFSTPSAGSPTQLLSQAAVLVSQSAIDNMLKSAAANALTLRLVDITPGANLAYHLREWQGDYRMTNDGDASSGTMLLTFDDPKIFKSCSDQLAGGIRGVFRVERGSGKSSAAAAAAAAAGGTADGVAGSTSNASASSSSSTSVKDKASSSRNASSGAAGSSSSSRAAAGWQTVSISKSRLTAAAAAAVPDPWADDELSLRNGSSSAAAAAASANAVVDDWEAGFSSDVDVPKGPAMKLEQHNMWDVLEDE